MSSRSSTPQIPETFKGVIENTIEEFRHLYPKWKQNRSLKRNRVVFESLNHLQNVLFRELPHDKEPDFSDKGGIREFIQSFKGFHKFLFHQLSPKIKKRFTSLTAE